MIVTLCILVTIAVIFGISLKRDEDVSDNNQPGQDITIYETDEDTVEKEAEGGLKESDSEDGPVLNEENMIDFNGGDVGDDSNPSDETTNSDDNGSGTEKNAEDNTGEGNGNKDNEEESPEEDKEEEEDDSGDTGSWGAFY